MLGSVISKIFGIEKAGVGAVICGWLTGFPIGVKVASELFLSGKIKKESAELLSVVANLPSPAFVVTATAMILGGAKSGVLIMLCIYLSAIITGVIFRSKTSNNDISCDIPRQNFDFVKSVKEAGFSTVGICSYIIFFSALTGIIRKHLKYDRLLFFILPFLEMTNAVNFISSSAGKINCLSLGFALGFGGLSVIMQSASFLKAAGLSLRKHFLMKLFQGCISALILHTIFYIIPFF